MGLCLYMQREWHGTVMLKSYNWVLFKEAIIKKLEIRVTWPNKHIIISRHLSYHPSFRGLSVRPTRQWIEKRLYITVTLNHEINSCEYQNTLFKSNQIYFTMIIDVGNLPQQSRGTKALSRRWTWPFLCKSPRPQHEPRNLNRKLLSLMGATEACRCR